MTSSLKKKKAAKLKEKYERILLQTKLKESLVQQKRELLRLKKVKKKEDEEDEDDDE